jgi:hypothetical protein
MNKIKERGRSSGRRKSSEGSVGPAAFAANFAKTLAARSESLVRVELAPPVETAKDTVARNSHALYRELFAPPVESSEHESALTTPTKDKPALRDKLAAERAGYDEFLRAHATASRAALVPGSAEAEAALREALAAARGISDEFFRAHALTILAPELPDAEWEAALRDALAAARAIPDGKSRAHALLALAPLLRSGRSTGTPVRGAHVILTGRFTP